MVAHHTEFEVEIGAVDIGRAVPQEQVERRQQHTTEYTQACIQQHMFYRRSVEESA